MLFLSYTCTITVMQGLLTKERKGIDPAAAPFAKTLAETEEMGLREGASLVEVVSIRS